MSKLGANFNPYNVTVYGLQRPTETAFGDPVVPLMLGQELYIIFTRIVNYLVNWILTMSSLSNEVEIRCCRLLSFVSSLQMKISLQSTVLFTPDLSSSSWYLPVLSTTTRFLSSGSSSHCMFPGSKYFRFGKTCDSISM